MTAHLWISAAVACAASLAASAFAIRIGPPASPAAKPLRAGKNIPELGGPILIAVILGSAWMGGLFQGRELLGVICGSALILIFGMWDTFRRLHPFAQLGAQIAVAVVTVLVSGLPISFITNPFGGLLGFAGWMGVVLAVVWIVIMMNVVNFLDGVDGVAGSVGVIGFLTIAAVSMLPYVHEPNTAMIALVAAAALLGFLFWNLPPARLYLGTSGAWYIGFLLAILAVQGSSKIATTAVVAAIPVLDTASVIITRLARKQRPWEGKDGLHLHDRLAAQGMSAHHILVLYASISAILGLAAVLLPTPYKVLFFCIVAAAFFTFTIRR